jgi:hypothetical protein
MAVLRESFIDPSIERVPAEAILIAVWRSGQEPDAAGPAKMRPPKIESGEREHGDEPGEDELEAATLACGRELRCDVIGFSREASIDDIHGRTPNLLTAS